MWYVSFSIEAMLVRVASQMRSLVIVMERMALHASPSASEMSRCFLLFILYMSSPSSQPMRMLSPSCLMALGLLMGIPSSDIC